MLRRMAVVSTDHSEEPSETSVLQLQLAVARQANVPSSPILVTLMMEEPSSSETSVLARATRRDIPEDAFLHSHAVKTSNVISNIYIRDDSGNKGLDFFMRQ
jgi:hypothetical protein